MALKFKNLKRDLSTGPQRLLKRICTILGTFLILAGSGFIVRAFILKPYFDELGAKGFLSNSPMFYPVYFIVLAGITFFIYELNKRIPHNAAAIGILIATIFSLPELINFTFYNIPAYVSIFTIIANFIAIPIAAYVFYTLWS